MFPLMPFAIGMLIISKTWSFCDTAQPPQTNATGGPPSVPPGSQLHGPSQTPCPRCGLRSHGATWILHPTGLCWGNEGCPSQAGVPHRLHCKPGSEACCAIAFSVVWRQFLLEFSFLLFEQKTKQNLENPSPSKKMVLLRFRRDLFPCFFHCFTFRVDSPPQLAHPGHRSRSTTTILLFHFCYLLIISLASSES